MATADLFPLLDAGESRTIVELYELWVMMARLTMNVHCSKEYTERRVEQILDMFCVMEMPTEDSEPDIRRVRDCLHDIKFIKRMKHVIKFQSCFALFIINVVRGDIPVFQELFEGAIQPMERIYESNLLPGRFLQRLGVTRESILFTLGYYGKQLVRLKPFCAYLSLDIREMIVEASDLFSIFKKKRDLYSDDQQPTSISSLTENEEEEEVEEEEPATLEHTLQTTSWWRRLFMSLRTTPVPEPVPEDDDGEKPVVKELDFELSYPDLENMERYRAVPSEIKYTWSSLVLLRRIILWNGVDKEWFRDYIGLCESKEDDLQVIFRTAFALEQIINVNKTPIGFMRKAMEHVMADFVRKGTLNLFYYDFVRPDLVCAMETMFRGESHALVRPFFMQYMLFTHDEIAKRLLPPKDYWRWHWRMYERFPE